MSQRIELGDTERRCASNELCDPSTTMSVHFRRVDWSVSDSSERADDVLVDLREVEHSNAESSFECRG
jgi:hypothetical protein